MTDQRPGAAAQQKSAARQQPLRVLIADDDRDGALTLSTLLELEGYEVRTVHGGQEALDTAREFRPDVALLDIGMPKITGWKQASDKILASLAGFDHHVAKPYEPAQLIALLSKL